MLAAVSVPAVHDTPAVHLSLAAQRGTAMGTWHMKISRATVELIWIGPRLPKKKCVWLLQYVARLFAYRTMSNGMFACMPWASAVQASVATPHCSVSVFPAILSPLIQTHRRRRADGPGDSVSLPSNAVVAGLAGRRLVRIKVQDEN